MPNFKGASEWDGANESQRLPVFGPGMGVEAGPKTWATSSQAVSCTLAAGDPATQCATQCFLKKTFDFLCFSLENIGLHIGLQASPQPMYRKGVFWPGWAWQGHAGTKQGQARARQPGFSRLGLSIGEGHVSNVTTSDSEADGPANLNAHLAESHTRILRHVAPAESRCASCRVLAQESTSRLSL